MHKEISSNCFCHNLKPQNVHAPAIKDSEQSLFCLHRRQNTLEPHITLGFIVNSRKVVYIPSKSDKIPSRWSLTESSDILSPYRGLRVKQGKEMKRRRKNRNLSSVEGHFNGSAMLCRLNCSSAVLSKSVCLSKCACRWELPPPQKHETGTRGDRGRRDGRLVGGAT